MRLMVELQLDDGHPNALLLERMNVSPPYADGSEETVVTNFVARLALSLLAEGHVRVLAFTKRRD